MVSLEASYKHDSRQTSNAQQVCFISMKFIFTTKHSKIYHKFFCYFLKRGYLFWERLGAFRKETHKMAMSPQHTAFSMSSKCDHVSAELAPTDQYTIMCRLHTLLHLFMLSRDEGFIKWHYGVSESLFLI